MQITHATMMMMQISVKAQAIRHTKDWTLATSQQSGNGSKE